MANQRSGAKPAGALAVVGQCMSACESIISWWPAKQVWIRSLNLKRLIVVCVGLLRTDGSPFSAWGCFRPMGRRVGLLYSSRGSVKSENAFSRAQTRSGMAVASETTHRSTFRMGNITDKIKRSRRRVQRVHSKLSADGTQRAHAKILLRAFESTRRVRTEF